MTGTSLSLQQLKVYASSQSQTQAPVQTTPQGQVTPPPTPICNPNSPLLQLRTTGAKVAELQGYLVQLGYGSLLGQKGIDGKFGLSTQNAVEKLQQDYRIPVDGKVGPRTWVVLCNAIASATGPVQQQPSVQQQPQGKAISSGCTNARPIPENLYSAFVHDAATSALDLLPRGQGEIYKNFNWDTYDFPLKNSGDPRFGLNENTAREMYRALAKIACEHRPIDARPPGKNGQFPPLASTAIARKDTLNPSLDPIMGRYVLEQIVPVPAQGKNELNRYAAESFAKMYADAKAKKVDLKILNSDRSCSAANARAGQVSNPNAVASCPNSHTIGLAIDFKMIPGPYQRDKELHTTPFKNIIDLLQTPTYKWLFLNAQKYGWYPYILEPWHWEYNPDNFRNTFFSEYEQFRASYEHNQNTPSMPAQQ
jgi:peptidoglycan hydrolase-like protein with peptidoglycan-binding domain